MRAAATAIRLPIADEVLDLFDARDPEEDLEWEPGKFSVKGSPDRFKTIQEIAFAAYTNYPQGMEMGLEAVDYYDPPNLTFPFGSRHLRRRHRQGDRARQRPPLRGRSTTAATSSIR